MAHIGILFPYSLLTTSKSSLKLCLSFFFPFAVRLRPFMWARWEAFMNPAGHIVPGQDMCTCRWKGTCMEIHERYMYMYVYIYTM